MGGSSGSAWQLEVWDPSSWSTPPPPPPKAPNPNWIEVLKPYITSKRTYEHLHLLSDFSSCYASNRYPPSLLTGLLGRDPPRTFSAAAWREVAAAVLGYTLVERRAENDEAYLEKVREEAERRDMKPRIISNPF